MVVYDDGGVDDGIKFYISQRLTRNSHPSFSLSHLFFP